MPIQLFSDQNLAFDERPGIKYICTKNNHGSVHFDNLISNKTKMKLKLTRFAGLILSLFIISGNIEITDGLVAETAIIAEATEIIGVVRIGVSLVDYIYKGRINFLVHQHLISNHV